MINIIDKTKCNGCHACMQKCPKNAIKMVKDEEGFLYPHVDIDLCIDCGLCKKVCAEIAPAKLSERSQVYAAYRRNFEKRMQSASGGIFACLAEYVLSKNGVVFGAAFDDDWVLKHHYIESISELKKLQGSKYVQSIIGNSYCDAESFLKKGKIVLFSGTPCQIQGLKKYLSKDYSNLLTVDLFCHGVPSPEVWNEYLKIMSKNRKLKSFCQRDKQNGITNAPLVFEFDNGDVLRQEYNKNLFIRGFISNLYLRRSCYYCSFKGIERCSDITIGDFWGADKFHPDFYDDYGVSAIVVHSDTGREYLSKIENDINIISSNYEEVIEQNECIIKPVNLNEKREIFFSLWKSKGLAKSIKKLENPIKKNTASELYHNFRHIMWVIKNKILLR